MFLDLSQGTFLWYWATSWAPLHGMVLAAIAATLVVFMTRWSPVRAFFKMGVAAGAFATAPLGLATMGITISVDNDHVVALLSLIGTVLAIGVAVPYLFYHTLRAATGKHSRYIGETVQFTGHQTAKVTDTPPSPQVVDVSPAAGEPAGMNTLDFTAGPKAGQTMNFDAKIISIGRSADNDIVVDDPTVSRHHARITNQGGTYRIEDLGSTSGTTVGGKEVTLAQIAPGSTVKLGNTELGFNMGAVGVKDAHVQKQEDLVPERSEATRIIDKSSPSLAWLAVSAGPGIGDTYQLKDGTNAVGREAAEMCIDDQYMSRKHAVVKVKNGSINVYDYGSTGGTRVNGKEITGKAIHPNSVLRVGETELKLMKIDNPSQFNQATMSGRTMVDQRGEHAAVLMSTSGRDAGRTFILLEGENTIGRGGSCGIDLSDDSASREHAMIRCEGGKLSVFDLGSTSGTSVDGQGIGGLTVNNGDVISMGRSEFTVMAPTAQPVGA